MEVNGKTSFRTDAEIVIPHFGHHVNLASTLCALPGGLVSDIKVSHMSESLFQGHNVPMKNMV